MLPDEYWTGWRAGPAPARLEADIGRLLQETKYYSCRYGNILRWEEL